MFLTMVKSQFLNVKFACVASRWTMSERRRNWRERPGGNTQWIDVDWLSTSIRLNILQVDIYIYSDLPDQGVSGQLVVIPERVNWESVRSVYAEQLRYNLRSPHLFKIYWMWSIIYELSDRLNVTKNSASTEVVILLGYPALHYFIFVDKLL